jgi:hypothetical protein
MQINHYSPKEHTKMSKIAKLAKCCKMRKIQLCKVCKFCILLYCVRKLIVAQNMVAISVRNTKVYKICELCKSIFSTFYNISQPNYAAILLILVCSFQKYTFLPR